MIKKKLKEDMNDFLQMLYKLLSKKRRQINKTKQKSNVKKTSLRKATISSLNNSVKKELLILILVIKISKPKIQDINITMIDADIYCAACHLKKAQVFAISMGDI